MNVRTSNPITNGLMEYAPRIGGGIERFACIKMYVVLQALVTAHSAGLTMILYLFSAKYEFGHWRAEKKLFKNSFSLGP